VLSNGLSLAAGGVLLGLGGAALVLPIFASLLYGVAPFDATTFIVTPVVLLGIAAVAAAIPAWRASRLDPMQAIREI
jgi:ABC-type antimicrobial peptide transport system permease subunit